MERLDREFNLRESFCVELTSKNAVVQECQNVGIVGKVYSSDISFDFVQLSNEVFGVIDFFSIGIEESFRIYVELVTVKVREQSVVSRNDIQNFLLFEPGDCDFFCKIKSVHFVSFLTFL